MILFFYIVYVSLSLPCAVVFSSFPLRQEHAVSVCLRRCLRPGSRTHTASGNRSDWQSENETDEDIDGKIAEGIVNGTRL